MSRDCIPCSEAFLEVSVSSEDPSRHPGDRGDGIDDLSLNLVETFVDVCRASCDMGFVGFGFLEEDGGSVPSVLCPLALDPCMHFW